MRVISALRAALPASTMVRTMEHSVTSTSLSISVGGCCCCKLNTAFSTSSRGTDPSSAVASTVIASAMATRSASDRWLASPPSAFAFI
jgi:hypothetical protein